LFGKLSADVKKRRQIFDEAPSERILYHSDGDDPGYWVAGFAKAVRFDGLLDYHGLAKVHNTSPLKQIFN